MPYILHFYFILRLLNMLSFHSGQLNPSILSGLLHDVQVLIETVRKITSQQTDTCALPLWSEWKCPNLLLAWTSCAVCGQSRVGGTLIIQGRSP